MGGGGRGRHEKCVRTSFWGPLHLDQATFEVKLKLIELLDVRGKLAIENEEKVVYIACKILNKPQRRSPVQTSLLRSTYQEKPITLTAKLVLG